MEKPALKTTPTEREVEKKWTKPLTDAGWTAIPNVIFERQHALGLEPLDIVIILHLAGFWWTAGNNPYPTKATLASAIGVSPRTIQRRIAALEVAGFIKRVLRRATHGGSKANEYSLAGLIAHATPFALEHVAERQARKEARAKRALRKKPALELVTK